MRQCQGHAPQRGGGLSDPQVSAVTGEHGLIVGAGGQDGAHAANRSLEQHGEVHGNRRVARRSLPNDRLPKWIANRVSVKAMARGDFRGIARVHLDEFCDLSGQSSVSVLFEKPIETPDGVIVAKDKLLEPIRLMARPRHTCSCEFVAGTGDVYVDEVAPLAPRSPERLG